MNKQALNYVYINEYNQGMSIWEIAEKYNNTYKNVYESISGKRFEARFLSLEEKEKICVMYRNGISTVKIGQKYGVGNKSIAVVLEEYNIQRDQASMVRRYKVDESYFDQINTANKAYILGFLSADGNNMPSKCTVSMSLEEQDKEILEKIRDEIKIERPLEFINYTNKNDFGYHYKNQYRLLIFSKHICHMLSKHGVVKNKSLILDFSNSVPVEFIRDYVRGVFDGDGSIGVRSIDNYAGHISVSITSTYKYLNKLSDILNDMGIYHTISDASNKNGITACLTINRNKDKKMFLDWIYNDAELFLRRKHDVYLYHYRLRACNAINSLTA